MTFAARTHARPPNAALYIHEGGHVELITDAAKQAGVIEEFRRSET
ncbi:MAG: hypothetical protein WBW75_27190 [Mycobacterium sp.]